MTPSGGGASRDYRPGMFKGADMDVRVAGRPAGDRIRFEGQMGPFLAAQIGRLILTVLTLGIHRFWWKTAIRRRLWTNTSVDGDPLEYRGRGIEMFVGALLVFALLRLPLSAISFAQAVLQGMGLAWVAMLLQMGLILGFLWLFGFAVYRTRRYMLSRTSWRGIRAGMTGNGLAYARLSFRLSLLNLVTLGFATPYSDARRWNALWGDAMFGTERVRARVDWKALTKSFWPAYIGCIIAFGLAFAMGFEGGEAAGRALAGDAGAMLDPAAGFAILKFYGYLVIAFLASIFLMLGYRAHFYQEALAATAVGGLRFGFSATATDWLKFHAGNMAWVVLTLGVGLLLLRLRLWRFWMDHLELYGEMDTGDIRQSVLRAPVQGDGLADAFDIGGI
jgi:uncharacterized membrane protein YjgN (DUF898 family)